MNNPFKRLKEWLNPKQSDQKLTKSNYLIIFACIGIILLIMSQLFQSEDAGESKQERLPVEEANNESSRFTSQGISDPLHDLERAYERDLAQMLEKIAGISNVEVMVNLEATSEKVFEKNLIVGTQITVESDQGGGTRNIDDLTEEQQIVTVRQGDQEVPLIVQSKKPVVRGVLVVANGVERMELKQWTTEAVSRVLSVPPHRISIMPREKGES